MKEYPDLFKRCLLVVLKNEGGYSNNPADPGGATMNGVTQAVYDQFRVKAGKEKQDVRLISIEEIYEVYYSLYWFPSNVGLLNDPDLILDVFDHGVNAGIRTAIKLLQRLVKVTDDGYIGKNTIFAVSNYPGDIVDDFKKQRKLFYVTLAQKKPDLRVFLKGWLARVDHTKL